MTDEVADQVLETPIFRAIDADQFPSTRSLRDVIRNDSKVTRYRRGDIIVRDGDYGSSAFVVLEGIVRVLLDPEGNREIAGRRDPKSGSWWKALAQHWRPSQVPERRNLTMYQSVGDVDLRTDDSDEARIFLKNPDRLVARFETAQLSQGQMFGEIAALSRSPRTATVFADSEDVIVVELRWQALREIRRRDSGFREHMDQLYRSRILISHLKEVPLLRHLDEERLKLIADQTLLEGHGDLEWHSSFSSSSPAGDGPSIEEEPPIAEEGHYLDGLLIVRSGFARVSRRLDSGHQTVGYLTANETFGLEEIVNHWRSGGELKLRSSLHALGFVDVFRLPTALVIEHVLPGAPKRMVRKLGKTNSRPVPAWQGRQRRDQISQTLLDALVDRRIINGQATMVIDTDRCVGCDDCVNACAVTHDNNPRFVRHGPAHAQLMFTNACMHCVDPVCLIGCPTGAIHRHPEDPRVLINDATCIGCGTCADSCPYDNIRMVEVRSPRGGFIVDNITRQPIVKATKCDLCADQLGGPACERACPHEALIRVDMRDRKRLARWVNGSGRLVRRIRNAALTMLAAAMITVLHLEWENSLRRSGLFSGWMMLGLVTVLVLFAVRKKLPGLPLVGASTWLQAHVYLGFLCALVFVLHGGWRLPDGVFEAALWLVLVFIVVSGIVGLGLSRWLPPRMERHGERVLFERIPVFRRQLAERVQALAMKSVRETASSTIVDYHCHRLAKFFAAPRGRLEHLLDSNRVVRRLQAETQHLRRYLDPRGCEILDEIEDCVAAKINLDYQHALQSVLRGWRVLHVPISYAAVVMIGIHVLMVFAFSGGGP